MENMSAPDDTQEPMEKRDLFHHGFISKLFSSNNMGLVRTVTGREIPFSFEFVILLGEAKSPADLKEGEEVGYDLGWTSQGLRVTKIKVYAALSPAEGDSYLERKGSQGQDLPS